jgi:hypothetical protein
MNPYNVLRCEGHRKISQRSLFSLFSTKQACFHVKNFEENGGFRTSNNITWHIAKTSVPAHKSHVVTPTVFHDFHPSRQKRVTKHFMQSTAYKSYLRWILLVTFFVFPQYIRCHYVSLLLRNDKAQVYILTVAAAVKYFPFSKQSGYHTQYMLIFKEKYVFPIGDKRTVLRNFFSITL